MTAISRTMQHTAEIAAAVAAERERIARHFNAKAEDARQKQMRAGNSFCSGNDWSIYGAKVERYKAVAAEIRNLKSE